MVSKKGRITWFGVREVKTRAMPYPWAQRRRQMAMIKASMLLFTTALVLLGIFVSALSFDGIDDLVEVPDDPSLDLMDDFTQDRHLPVLRSGEWRTYAGGPHRLFFNPGERIITAANVSQLQVKWTFPTEAIVTASPSVAHLSVPGEGRVPVAFIQSWDGTLYALRVHDGTELWRFQTAPQPGSAFPNAASVDVRRVGGQERVYLAAGETVYSLDALTGRELWRFDAGTGCVDPPGLCGFEGERNQVLSSPIVADGKVFFGMDVNDREGGKGGFYAVDAHDGRLVWFFDLETGATCHPFPMDNIRRFDGYHSEKELGLPSGFLANRPGCGFDRTPTGCGNVWSSAAIDQKRQLLFFASSNCDTDQDPATLKPPPPMPPYDEAIVALYFDVHRHGAGDPGRWTTITLPLGRYRISSKSSWGGTAAMWSGSATRMGHTTSLTARGSMFSLVCAGTTAIPPPCRIGQQKWCQGGISVGSSPPRPSIGRPAASTLVRLPALTHSTRSGQRSTRLIRIRVLCSGRTPKRKTPTRASPLPVRFRVLSSSAASSMVYSGPTMPLRGRNSQAFASASH